MKMADCVHLNHLLIPVICRFNINLGFKDATIEKICEEKNINLEFFLNIINAYNDKDYFPKQHLQSISVIEIIEYLKKTHQFYIHKVIPEIERLLNKMIKICYPEQENIDLINNFFANYKTELIHHVEREENVVFPYAIEIEKSYNNKSISNSLKKLMKNYSMKKYKIEHDDMEEKLFDLKNIIIKYLPEPKDNYLCSKVLNEIFYLEDDLNNHSHIEEKVMIPKIIKMEISLNKLSK